MLVFDPNLWAGRDVGDNSQFWKEADIIERTTHDGEPTATVRFRHDGRVSRGHFVAGMRHATPSSRDRP